LKSNVRRSQISQSLEWLQHDGHFVTAVQKIQA
jgi:hypothetical protein